MTNSNDVPDRELCVRMAELGICQDEPELFWNRNDKYRNYPSMEDGTTSIYRHTVLETRWTLDAYRKSPIHNFPAPTLHRMMKELPNTIQIGRMINGTWHTYKTEGIVRSGYYEGEVIPVSSDKHLPNAVAKALIEIADLDRKQ